MFWRRKPVVALASADRQSAPEIANKTVTTAPGIVPITAESSTDVMPASNATIAADLPSRSTRKLIRICCFLCLVTRASAAILLPSASSRATSRRSITGRKRRSPNSRADSSSGDTGNLETVAMTSPDSTDRNVHDFFAEPHLARMLEDPREVVDLLLGSQNHWVALPAIE